MSIIVYIIFYKYYTPLPIDSTYPHVKYTPQIKILISICIQSITRRQPHPPPASGGQALQATSPYPPLEGDKGKVLRKPTPRQELRRRPDAPGKLQPTKLGKECNLV